MSDSSAILVSDLDAARAELRGGQYGAFANAEELIRSHSAATSPEVRAASMKRLNEDATLSLDKSKIEVPAGGKLVDAVVRANQISFVWEAPDGRWYKGAVAYDKSYEGEPRTPEEKSLDASLANDLAVRDASLEANALVAAASVAAARAVTTSHAEDLRKIQEQHRKDMVALVKEINEGGDGSETLGKISVSIDSDSENSGGSKTGGSRAGSGASTGSGGGQSVRSNADADKLAKKLGVVFPDDASFADKKALLAEAEAKSEGDKVGGTPDGATEASQAERKVNEG
jgi:hypothetical protein